MVQLTVCYGHPTDPAVFDSHYHQTHSQLALKLPGLKGYFSTQPESLNPAEKAPHYLIAELFFESKEAFQAALQSPEGQATAADAQQLATGGVTMFLAEVDAHRSVLIG